MIDSMVADMGVPHASAARAHAPHEDGWYLYGITRRHPRSPAQGWTGAPEHNAVEIPLDLGADHELVQLLEGANLAAIVRRVPLAAFTAEALQAQLGDPTWLQSIVQEHNDVIRAIHETRAILPAKFGAVYARLEDIASAMEQRSDILLAQLERLEGCDEWAVHVYVDQRIVRAQVRAAQATDPTLQQLDATRPGRAYFLRRKLDDDLAAKTAQMTEDVALAAYEQLARLAIDGVAERPASLSGDADGDTEVLRAAFLVRRERSEDFAATARAHAEDEQGWHCTYSGPWPPYSFAAIPERER